VRSNSDHTKQPTTATATSATPLGKQRTVATQAMGSQSTKSLTEEAEGTTTKEVDYVGGQPHLQRVRFSSDIEHYDGPDRLTTLEIELLYHVASYLPVSDLVSLGSANSHFRGVLLDNDDLWKQRCKSVVGFSLTLDPKRELVTNL